MSKNDSTTISIEKTVLEKLNLICKITNGTKQNTLTRLLNDEIHKTIIDKRMVRIYELNEDEIGLLGYDPKEFQKWDKSQKEVEIIGTSKHRKNYQERW